MKNKAFTVIELLVVIAVIGILSTISIATYNDYGSKSQDAVKQSTLASIYRIAQVDSAIKEGADLYLYTAAEFSELLSKSGMSLNPTDKESCYFLSAGAGTDPVDPRDNRFAIMTWGETTSTFNKKTPGVLVVGDSESVNYIKTQSLTKDDFSCNAAWVFEEKSNDSNIFIASLFGQAYAAPKPKVTICHIPPGNPGNYRTLSVGESAVSSHLGHGDYEGECSEAVPPEDPAVETEEAEEGVAEYSVLQDMVDAAGFNTPRSTVLIDKDGNVIQLELILE